MKLMSSFNILLTTSCFYLIHLTDHHHIQLYLPFQRAKCMVLVLRTAVVIICFCILLSFGRLSIIAFRTIVRNTDGNIRSVCNEGVCSFYRFE
jgi:hypothetical protein